MYKTPNKKETINLKLKLPFGAEYGSHINFRNLKQQDFHLMNPFLCISLILSTKGWNGSFSPTIRISRVSGNRKFSRHYLPLLAILKFWLIQLLPRTIQWIFLSSLLFKLTCYFQRRFKCNCKRMMPITKSKMEFGMGGSPYMYMT